MNNNLHKDRENVNVETSIRCDHNQDPAVFEVTKIKYNEKKSKEKPASELVFLCCFFIIVYQENGLFLHVNIMAILSGTSLLSVSLIHFSCFILYPECVVTLHCNFKYNS